MGGAGRTFIRAGAERIRSVWTRSPLADSYGRLAPVLVPVSVAGLAVLAVAATTLPYTLSAGDTLGIVVLVTGAMLAEAFPVPIELEGVAAGGVSLAAVFIVGAAIIYGWATAVVVAFVALGVVQALHRRGATKLLYNGSVYALGALAAGLAAAPVAVDGSIGSLVAAVVVGGLAFYAVNVALIAAVVARLADERFLDLVGRSIRSTAIPFSIMASVSLTLTVLWEHSPLLSAALVGPLVAVALYQRSVHEALTAMRLALTDPLTGLGNHRHFHDRLQRDLDRAQARSAPFSLCLVDVDDFKEVNDNHGHPVGDRVLAQVATRLRTGGEAFRLGGDEFALLLPGRTETEALAIADTVIARIAELDLEHGGRLTVSAGVASFPDHGVERAELVRVADNALYWSKEHGKGRASVYRPGAVELGELHRLAQERDRRARFLAAAGLARAVDARDAYTGEHSAEVGALAARIAVRMGLDSDEVELIRLAGSLHDVGKLAIPEDILRKPGPLSEPERVVLERHPQIGFRMLDSLGVEPVATWVLHHHERWDGDGYPNRLSGPRIPLGARILFVADAYDAMTTDRVYRRSLPHDAAIRELERCAGSQFDPDVVAALKTELEEVGVESAVDSVGVAAVAR
jgi:diguanylate cyclase (GGDEF)-like protein/putative nucleotidyltransferase with HDIG domain